MGDRIEDLPVDQIVPSQDEKKILDTVFMTHGPSPTQTIKRVGVSPITKDEERPLTIPASTSTPLPTLTPAPAQCKKPFQKELGTVITLAGLFLICSLPQLDPIVFSMIPFLRRSALSYLIFRSVVFMMLAYVMINWELLRVASPPDAAAAAQQTLLFSSSL